MGFNLLSRRIGTILKGFLLIMAGIAIVLQYPVLGIVFDGAIAVGLWRWRQLRKKRIHEDNRALRGTLSR